MTTAWMIYVVAAGAAFGVAAHLSERALSLLGRPARWPWLAAMLATVLWPFAAAVVFRSDAASRPGVLPFVEGAVGTATSAAWRAAAADVATGMPELWLMGSWLAVSALLLVLLLLAAEVLRRERRWWRPGVVAGERVLLSPAIGPAVIGTLRPRIVVPRRMLELDAPVQRLIVLHEREHVRAGDSRLMAFGLLLLLLVPWCLPLWWHFQRLRLAIEMDCDRRLLRAGAQPRAYAEALLTVARWKPAMLPLAAMASSKATLERRIRSIVTRQATASPRRALLPLSAAALLLLVSAAVPAPPPPGAGSLHALRGASAAAREADALPPLPDGSVPGGLRFDGSLADGSLPDRAQPDGAMFDGPLPDGSLPGDPGAARLAAALATHHAALAGIPPGSIVWFVADRDGAVRRTGIDRGTEAEVILRVRARFPRETSDMVLAFSDVPTGGGTVDVLWMLPAP